LRSWHSAQIAGDSTVLKAYHNCKLPWLCWVAFRWRTWQQQLGCCCAVAGSCG
jgi:hypothetical protein